MARLDRLRLGGNCDDDNEDERWTKLFKYVVGANFNLRYS